ncbi:hypothetical protein RhiirA4_484714 [Rhizophagus irregularis]|uniref:ZSWIM1/3 RNaseH-like domain-containing protein n=1 Tax=Rhizophagus irregularis TaxID=588596 RepID=A0A2I1HP94_9GLOM|nr:hypothetical protein RhiirA4_484714 [Rhizophagus irregularis]
MSVDTFMYNYCLERGFSYQICRNDKDPNNPSITIHKSHKSYHCSFNGTYKPRKNINQELQWERDSNKFNCQWHCNFTLQKLENQNVYNSIYHLRKNNEEENSDTTSFLNIFFEKIIEDPHWKIFVRHSGNKHCLSGIFWMSPSQYELYQQFHNIVLNDNTCKTNKYNMYLSVFMINDNYGKFHNVANALVEDEMASTYIWILQCN